MRKWLLIILGVLVLIFLGLFFWFKSPLPINRTEEIQNTRQYQVQPLTDDKEIDLGTIIYPAAKVIKDLSSESGSEATFEVTDTFDAVVQVYIDDLANRYPENRLTKKEIGQKEALNGQAIVLNSIGNGEITVTAWPTKSGFTDFVISRK